MSKTVDGSSETTATPYHEHAMLKHLRRQAMILKVLIGENTPSDESVNELADKLETSLFTPTERKNEGEPDPKLNFYPPFLVPECLALHFPFFLSLPIPMSCKANRVGTSTYRIWLEETNLPLKFPDPCSTRWSDVLGKVDTIADLKNNQKFALLKDDSSRLSWFKSKALQMQTFAYPSIGLPPAVQKLLVTEYIGEAQTPNELDTNYTFSITDEHITELTGEKNVKLVRDKISYGITQSALLYTMKRFFCHPSVVKGLQESLHYTFGHGFVKVIQLLTDCNLSEFVTFHGLTHRNRLNNNSLHLQLDGVDKIDYIVDTIYLFLVFTWQTAMDIWQQVMDEKTLEQLKQALEAAKDIIIDAPNSLKIGEKISSIIFPDVMLQALTTNLPDFVSQTQLQNFRSFICIKSGVPQGICPLLPSDVVPLTYFESHPVLWGHVFLLRQAAFLLNHGNYMIDVEPPYVLSTCFCECNLCSPHRMPCYNLHLMQEIQTIGKFNFQGPPDENGETKTLQLSPQTFANAYLKHFVPTDFHYSTVIHYKKHRDAFNGPMSACVLKDSKLLAMLRETQIRREKELLKRGGGLYLDPETGEPLSVTATPFNSDSEDDGENIQTNAIIQPSTPRQREKLALPTIPEHPTPKGNRRSTHGRGGRGRRIHERRSKSEQQPSPSSKEEA